MDDVEITRNAFLAGRGDRVAAGNFVSATQRQLYRLLSYLSNADVAEDLVQETYLRAFAALPRFAGRAPARMWLLAIAKHVAADHLRGHRRRPKTSPAEDWVLAAEHSGTSVPDRGRLVVLRPAGRRTRRRAPRSLRLDPNARTVLCRGRGGLCVRRRHHPVPGLPRT